MPLGSLPVDADARGWLRVTTAAHAGARIFRTPALEWPGYPQAVTEPLLLDYCCWATHDSCRPV
jgi:hypothetical protein